MLYRSCRKIFALPPETRLFLCHDYKAPGRDDYRWETTVAEERARNVHVHDGIGEDAFVVMRQARDATLGMPRLIRSEEHTSELQSLMRISYAVFCLKKKNINTTKHKIH